MIRVLLILVLIFQFRAFAQFNQDSSKNVSYIALPIIFSTPETDLGYGLMGSLSFKTSFKNDSETRSSIIQTMGIFTTRQQNIQFIDATIFFPKEKFVAILQTSHSYFPDKFWGIGPYSKNSYQEKYAFKQFNFLSHLKKKIFNRAFIGLIYEYQNVYETDYIPNGVFDTSSFYGKKPYNVSAVGVSMSYDSRNSSVWPTDGVFAQSSYERYDKFIGSQFRLGKWITDLRGFKKIFFNHVVAMQAYFYLTHGQTPLRELANFGGVNNIRGYYQGRFRDQSMMTLIFEYRAPLLGRLSAIGFAGAGGVYSNDYDLKWKTLKFTVGGGLRIAMLKKEKLNLRIDFGYADKKSFGFYFTVGECF